MNFGHATTRLFVPDGVDADKALGRCSHLGIGAHQDDLEIMALHGVLQCFDSRDRWFCGVTCTDGTGGPRKDELAHLSPEDIGSLRNEEQEDAARLGRYGAMVQLNYPSDAVKGDSQAAVVASLLEILSLVQPEVVYTHNPADKHDTHVGVVTATLAAIRKMPAARRPNKLYGCEVWRDLDWLDDEEKVRLDVSGNDLLAESLINCHASQVTPAKRYDLATIGRRRANATYADSHANSAATAVTHAMDLSALVLDDALSLQTFVATRIHRFEKSVVANLAGQPGT